MFSPCFTLFWGYSIWLQANVAVLLHCLPCLECLLKKLLFPQNNWHFQLHNFFPSNFQGISHIWLQASLGLKANFYVIIGEFLTKLFQELTASPLSITERLIWIQWYPDYKCCHSSNIKYYKRGPLAIDWFFLCKKDRSQEVHAVYTTLGFIVV